MARLTSIPPIIGTIGPVTIYEMFDWYYMRSRSSLTAERVKTDPAFRKLMQYANLMAVASPISSTVYALIPIQRRKRGLRNKITGEAMTWLKYQWTKEEIIAYLTLRYTGTKPPPKDGVYTSLRKNNQCSKLQMKNLPTGAKKTTLSVDQLSLNEWQRHDRQFRKLYHQSFSDFAWSKALQEAGVRKCQRPTGLAEPGS